MLHAGADAAGLSSGTLGAYGPTSGGTRLRIAVENLAVNVTRSMCSATFGSSAATVIDCFAARINRRATQTDLPMFMVTFVVEAPAAASSDSGPVVIELLAASATVPLSFRRAVMSFRYVESRALTVSSVSPSRGVVTGGSPVLITVANLPVITRSSDLDVTSAGRGGASVSGVMVASSSPAQTVILIPSMPTAPAGTNRSSTDTLTVRHIPTGMSVTLAYNYIFNASFISAIYPASGSAAGGDTVNIDIAGIPAQVTIREVRFAGQFAVCERENIIGTITRVKCITPALAVGVGASVTVTAVLSNNMQVSGAPFGTVGGSVGRLSSFAVVETKGDERDRVVTFGPSRDTSTTSADWAPTPVKNQRKVRVVFEASQLNRRVTDTSGFDLLVSHSSGNTFNTTDKTLILSTSTFLRASVVLDLGRFNSPGLLEARLLVGGQEVARRSRVIRVVDESSTLVVSVRPSRGSPAGGKTITVTVDSSTASSWRGATIGSDSTSFVSSSISPLNPRFSDVVVRLPPRPADTYTFTLAGTSAQSSSPFEVEYVQDPATPSVVRVSRTQGPFSGGTRVQVDLRDFPIVEDMSVGSSQTPAVAICMDAACASPIVPTSVLSAQSITTVSFVTTAQRPGLSEIWIGRTTGNNANRARMAFHFTDGRMARIVSANPLYGHTLGGYTVSTVIEGLITSWAAYNTSAPFPALVQVGGVMVPGAVVSPGPLINDTSLATVTFTVPALPQGSHVVLVNDASWSREAFFTLNVAAPPAGPAELSAVQPSSADMVAGDRITVTLTNMRIPVQESSLRAVFNVSSNVTLTNVSMTGSIVPGSMVTSDRSITVQITVPVLPASRLGLGDVNSTLFVWQSSGGSAAQELLDRQLSASTTFIFEDRSIARIVSISPSAGSPLGGTLVAVRVRDFVRVSNPNDVQIISVATGARGVATSVLGYDGTTRITTILVRTLAAPPPGSPWTLQLSPLGISRPSAAPTFLFAASSQGDIRSIAPASGSTDGGQLVSISVRGVSAASAASSNAIVTFAGTAAQVQSVRTTRDRLENGVDVSTIVCLTPPQDAVVGPVAVQVTIGGATRNTMYEYVAPMQPVIVSMTPSSGSVAGGTIVTILVSSLGKLDGAMLLVTFRGVGAQSTVVSSNATAHMIRVITPPQTEASEVTVLISASAVPETHSSSRIAVGTFRYEWTDPPLSMVVSGGPVPSRGPATGGTLAFVTLRNAPAAALKDMQVSIFGRACETVRYEIVSDTESTLYFTTPLIDAVVAPSSVRGRVAAVGTSLARYTSVFDFMLTTDVDSPYATSIFPSTGSAVGGTQVRVVLTNFMIVSDVRQLQVSFGAVPGTVDRIISSTRAATELIVTSPQFTCSNLVRPLDTCTVQASITAVWDPSRTSAAIFPFVYSSAAVTVSRVSPPSLQEAIGGLVTLAISNFPVISRVEEVEIGFGGMGPAVYPREVLYSDRAVTIMTFNAPPVSPSTTATFVASPVFFAARAVTFQMAYQGALDTKLVSFSPSMGPATGFFTIDVVIDKFPIRPVGSYDANYMDVSGPQDAAIRIGSCLSCATVIGSAIVRGGLSTANSTSQITFNVSTPLPPGTHIVRVGRANTLPLIGLVEFTIQIYDPSTPAVLSVNPSSGLRGTSNMVAVQVGSLHLSSQPDSLIALIGGVRANVVSMATNGFITSVVLKLPVVATSGMATVTLSSSASPTQQASFSFQHQDPCDYDSFCTSALVGSVKNTARILSSALSATCDVSMCISPELVASPVVTHVSESRGPTVGGSIVTVMLRGLPSRSRSDILVRFDASQAEIQSYQSLDGGSTQLIVRTPPGASGTVKASIESALGGTPPATFDFIYLPNYSAAQVAVAEVSPVVCFKNDIVQATVTLPVWNFAPLTSTVHTVEGANGWVLPAVNASVLFSEAGGETRLNFTFTCPSTGGVGRLVVKRSDVPAHIATSNQLDSRDRTYEIASYFPTGGPKAGGFDVSLYIANVLDTDKIAGISATNTTLVPGAFTIKSRTLQSDGAAVVFTMPPCTAEGTTGLTIAFSDSMPHTIMFSCEDPDMLTAPVVSFVSQRTSSQLGGTSINVWVDGLEPLDDPTDLRSIVVLFETSEATVTRVRSSTYDRTVLDFLTPPWPTLSNVSVSIYRRKEAPRADNTGKYMHSFGPARAVLDVSQGSVSGGLVVQATIFGFRQLESQSYTSLVAKFGNEDGKVLGIQSSIVGRTVITVQVPPAMSPGFVTLRITSKLFTDEPASTTNFRYYAPASIASVLPSLGPIAGGNLVTVRISGMRPVVSASQLTVKFGQMDGSVSRLVTSSDFNTVVEVIAPDYRMVGSGLVHATITPSYLSSVSEQQHTSLSFSYMYLPQNPAVIDVSPPQAPASTATIIALSLVGFPILSSTSSVQLQLGSIIVPASAVAYSDSQGSKIHAMLPAGLLPAGTHVGIVRNGLVYATFQYTALPEMVTVGSVTGNAGPSEGGTLMTVSLIGSPAIRSIAGATVTFGSVPARIVRVINTVTTVVGRIATTVLELESPPLSGPVPFDANGSAVVQVYGRLQPGDSAATQDFATRFTYRAPLSIASATLDGVGARLTIVLNQPAKDVAIYTRRACDVGVFHPSTLARFGADPMCTWNGPSELQVSLGAGSDVLPGMIGVMSQDIKPANTLSKRGDMAFTVLNSPARQSPSGALVGASIVGPCEDLLVRCTAQVPPRSIFKWSCSAHEMGSDEVCRTLSRRLMRERGDQITLSRQDLSSITEPLAIYTLSVQVEDETGARSVFDHSFSRSKFSVPSVTVYGAGTSYASDQYVLLQATSVPSTCPVNPYGAPCVPGRYASGVQACLPCSLMASSPAAKAECPFGTYIMYRWFPVDSHGRASNIPVSDGPELLIPAPLSVSNDAAYTYILAAYSANDGASIGEIPVRFRVHAAPLRAIISGSDRLVSASAGAVVDASMSGDGLTHVPLSFAWSCMYVSSLTNGAAVKNMPCRTANGALLLPGTSTASSSPSIMIPPGQMLAGDVYEFAAMVRVAGSSRDTRSASATVRLYATNAPASYTSTSIVRTSANSATVLPPTLTTSEAVLLQSEPLFTSSLEWGVVGSSLAVAASDELTYPLGLIAPRFKVSPGTLLEGASYTFTLRDEGGVPQAWYTLQVPVGPSGGSCTLLPMEGTALTTDFTVSCKGFEDEHGRLTYSYGLNVTNGIISSTWATPSPSATFKLPTGSAVTVIVTVRDTMDAVRVVSTNAVAVSRSSVPTKEALNALANTVLGPAVRSGDEVMLEVNLLSIVLTLPTLTFTESLQIVRDTLAAALDAVVQRTAVTPVMAKRMVMLAASIAQKTSEMTLESVESLARTMERISSPATMGLAASSLTITEGAFVLSAVDTMMAAIKLRREGGNVVTLEQEAIFGRAIELTINAVAKATLRDMAVGEEDKMVCRNVFLLLLCHVFVCLILVHTSPNGFEPFARFMHLCTSFARMHTTMHLPRSRRLIFTSRTQHM
jgi:hypothetical protein